MVFTYRLPDFADAKVDAVQFVDVKPKKADTLDYIDLGPDLAATITNPCPCVHDPAECLFWVRLDDRLRRSNGERNHHKHPEVTDAKLAKEHDHLARRHAKFKPLNTLLSLQPPLFDQRSAESKSKSTLDTTNSSDQGEKKPTRDTRNLPSGYEKRTPFAQPGRDKSMVRERDQSRTSSGQYLSPQKRAPLANISAKMQSPSSKPQAPGAQGEDKSAKAPVNPLQPEFGQASPLRNPLKKQTQDRGDPFIHRKPPVQARPPPQRPFVQQPSQQSSAGAAPQYSHPYPVASAPEGAREFYMPRQRPSVPAQQSSLPAAQNIMNQPYSRTFQPAPSHVGQPSNPPPHAIQPAPRPTFSSIGPDTYFQAFAPPKQVVDLTKASDDDEFDPDAAIRAEGRTFGAVDPYMYVDSTQASDNIKNLLEGAFDDEDDKPKMRLRKRGKKAVKEDNDAKSLADKLAALNVEDAENKTKPEEEDEDEDGTVDGMTIKLLPHQVEGVSWMIDKEIGARKKNGVLPHGGILADDMGLGKTVQSVALILTNPRPALDAKPDHPKQKLPGKEVGKSTLVVAPLALIKQWESEIKTKVSKSHSLKVLIHHGPSRTKSAAELKKYDVVITTYQILASEHAGSNMDAPGGAKVGCMGVHWYRVMLDEAHSIKNRSAKSTLACCALQSWYRWCLTGTPMQNNLDELQSLIRFLRIKPYCDLPNWKDQITGPMKSGRGVLAMKRLQFFLKAFMKRRTKDILKKEGALNFGGKTAGKDGEKKEGMKIVKREVVTMECDFDEAEQEFYTRLQNRAENRLNDMMQAGGKADYIGALVLLLRLRQACNHPHLIEMAMNKDKDAMTTGTSMGISGTQTPKKGSRVEENEMDDLAALMGGVSVESRSCDVCQIELSAAEAKNGAVRCHECEEDLATMKRGGKKDKKKEKREEKKTTAKPTKPRPMRNRRVLEDSDDEGEGEWIADGPEGKIDLSRAGGTDDEDADGGGDTLGVEDSDTDDEEEDRHAGSNKRRSARDSDASEQDSVDEESADDASSAEDSDESGSDTGYPMLKGMAPSHKAKHAPSTKIRHMLRILHADAPEHKTIIFSQFTTMLDVIEPHLRHAKISFMRYDGSMKPDAREASLNSLKNDPKTRVLLCSLKCGSLGLNLTAASRVIIVEPFWNPFVEEQAIDRVHRLNQTVDVKVYRLTVRNTVEEKILALQEKKRQLANAAIESGSGKGLGKLSMADILGLFRRDAEVGHEDDSSSDLFQRSGNLLDAPTAGAREVSDLRTAQASVSRKGNEVRRSGGAQPRKEHEVYGRRW